MYLGDPFKVLREHIYVLDMVKDFISRPVGKELRADGTTFKCSLMLTINVCDVCRCSVINYVIAATKNIRTTAKQF